MNVIQTQFGTIYRSAEIAREYSCLSSTELRNHNTRMTMTLQALGAFLGEELQQVAILEAHGNSQSVYRYEHAGELYRVIDWVLAREEKLVGIDVCNTHGVNLRTHSKSIVFPGGDSCMDWVPLVASAIARDSKLGLA